VERDQVGADDMGGQGGSGSYATSPLMTACIHVTSAHRCHGCNLDWFRLLNRPMNRKDLSKRKKQRAGAAHETKFVRLHGTRILHLIRRL
jgi:hypothetical protein